MIIFAEPICFEEQHLFFNKTFISSIDLICLDRSYIWCGDKNYGQNVFVLTKPLKSETIEYQKHLTLLELWRRYRVINGGLSQETSKYPLIFLSFDNSLFPFFCLLNYNKLKRKKIICIVHNNLRLIQSSIIKKFIFRALNKLIAVEYVVLTESMKSHADKLLVTNSKLFHHPFYQSPINIKKTKNGETVNFLVMGRQAIEFCKSDLYDKFIATAESYSGTRKVSISIISPIPTNLRSYNSSKVTTNFIVATLSDEEYWKYFELANFVIFPPSEEISYRASGVLMDTFASKSIFIAPELGHSNEFKGCGLFYNDDTFSAILEKALYIKSTEVEAMYKQLKSIRISKERDNRVMLKKILSN